MEIFAISGDTVAVNTFRSTQQNLSFIYSPAELFDSVNNTIVIPKDTSIEYWIVPFDSNQIITGCNPEGSHWIVQCTCNDDMGPIGCHVVWINWEHWIQFGCQKDPQKCDCCGMHMYNISGGGQVNGSFVIIKTKFLKYNGHLIK